MDAVVLKKEVSGVPDDGIVLTDMDIDKFEWGSSHPNCEAILVKHPRSEVRKAHMVGYSVSAQYNDALRDLFEREFSDTGKYMMIHFAGRRDTFEV